MRFSSNGDQICSVSDDRSVRLWQLPDNYSNHIGLDYIRGGWKRFKRNTNILLIIAFFCWVFHVTLNGHNTLLKKLWGLLGLTRYSDPASHKHHGNVLCVVKARKFWGEINKL